MTADRITRLKIEGLRCIGSIDLAVKDFTVLIGENGTGKSTVIEALEILRKAATGGVLVDQLYQHHDGTRLIHAGAQVLTVSVTLGTVSPTLEYSLDVLNDGGQLRVHAEILRDQENVLVGRSGRTVGLPSTLDGRVDAKRDVVDSHETVLPHAAFLGIPELARVQRALASIEVHTPLDLRRTWSHAQTSQTARSSNLARPAERVEPGGANLVNVYAALKNQRNWRQTLGRLQVSLGDVEDVLLVSEPSGGTQTIWLRWHNGSEIPLSGLSDGQISMLALIAIQQLQRRTPPSLVAIDEPEVHLHPGLIARVATGLQELSEEIPILVGTQSDAFLNAIEQPVESVVLCQLDEQRRTKLQRPEREQLEAWLTEFKGLGAIRSEGLQGVVFPASS